jgi:hypothetical protein
MEPVALASVLLATVLAYGADGARGSARWRLMTSPARRSAARGLATSLVLAGFLLWRQAEPGPAAFLAIPVALMACGTFVTLLGPTRPRWLAAISIAALPLAALLAALGGAHG